MGTAAALALARSNTYIPPSSRDPRNPRPPTMIERHMNRAGAGAGGGGWAPGMIVPGSALESNATPFGPYSNAYTPPAEYHQNQLTREPSGGAGSYGPYTPPQTGSGSPPDMTPFQQQQYAEITRELNRQPSRGGAPMPPYRAESDGPFADPIPFTTSPPPMVNNGPGVQRSLTVTYASLSSARPTDSLPTRTGTPSDPNPQQAFFPPAAGAAAAYPELSQALAMPQSGNLVKVHESEAIAHQAHIGVMGVDLHSGAGNTNNDTLAVPHNAAAQRESVYEPDDAYGGI